MGHRGCVGRELWRCVLAWKTELQLTQPCKIFSNCLGLSPVTPRDEPSTHLVSTAIGTGQEGRDTPNPPMCKQPDPILTQHHEQLRNPVDLQGQKLCRPTWGGYHCVPHTAEPSINTQVGSSTMYLQEIVSSACVYQGHPVEWLTVCLLPNTAVNPLQQKSQIQSPGASQSTRYPLRIKYSIWA